MPSRGNRALATVFVLLALIFIVVAIFYATQSTDLLASGVGIHYKHAALAAVLAVLSLIAANIVRPHRA